MGANEQLPAFIRVINQELGAFFDGVKEFSKVGIAKGGFVGDEDQLVIRRHTFFFRIKSLSRLIDDVHLVQFEISESPDNRIDLAGNDGW